MNYQSMCTNVFENLVSTVNEYQNHPKTGFEELYYNTLENCEKSFDQKPPEFVWKSYETEEGLQNTIHYEVDFLRIVIYRYYVNYLKIYSEEAWSLTVQKN